MKASRHPPGRQGRTVSSESKGGEAVQSKYKRGDYVLAELISSAGPTGSIWMCVDHSDDKHAIVFGTIDDDKSHGLDKALRSGAKLAASYLRVRECRVALR